MADIIINKWQDGIGKSSATGFANMKNVDIESVPGVVMCGNSSLTYYPIPASDTTFTADASTDLITYSGGWASYTVGSTTSSGAYRPVTVSNSGGALPAGLVASTIYYISADTSTTTKLYPTYYDSINDTNAINITDAGTGTHTISSVNMATIKHFAKDPNTGKIFALDSSGRLWFTDSGVSSAFHLLDGNTLTGALGQGLAVWKNYVLVWRDTDIDVYDISRTQGWTKDWKNAWITSVSPNNNHHAIVGQDDEVYYCNGNQLGNIAEATGTFDPDSAGTYASTLDSIVLPTQTNLTRLSELGDNLVLGTDTNRIYFWDYANADVTARVYWNEQGVDSFTTIGNNTYIFGGTRGIIYATNGVVVQEVKRIPSDLSLGFDNNRVTFGGSVQMGNKLLFGVKMQGTSNDGVYSLDINTGALILENQVNQSYLSQTDINDLLVVGNNSNTYLIGRGDGFTTGGIDLVSNDRRYQNYESVIESSLLRVGTAERKLNVSKLYIDFDKKLNTGEGIKLYYRENLSDNYTLIGTFDNATYGSVASIQKAFSRNLDNIQIKIEMTTNNVTGQTNTRLREIRIR